MEPSVILTIIGLVFSNIVALGVAVWKIGRWTIRIESKLGTIERDLASITDPLRIHIGTTGY